MVSCLYKKSVFRKKPGQINIDFIAGFLLFIVSVLYVSTSAIKTIPLFQDKIEDDNNHLELWTLSERLMHNIESESYVLDPKKIDGIDAMSYDAIKKLLGVDEKNNFILKVYQYPIIRTLEDINGSYIGTAPFEGVDVVFNNTGYLVYINGEPIGISDTKILSGRVYGIEDIDEQKKYVILNTILVEKDNVYEIKKTTNVIVRYSTYDSFIAEIVITYF